MEHYIHHVPGRLRIKNPEIKRNPVLGGEVRECIMSARGVEKVTVNPLTGSVLIEYDPKVVSQEILVTVLEECEYLDTTKAKTLNQSMHSGLSTFGERVGKVCLGMLVEQGLKRTGFSFLAALI